MRVGRIMIENDQSRSVVSLGSILRDLKESQKASLQDLTVLSPSNDPYRLDTPANHRLGQWLRDAMASTGLLTRPTPIHNRGVFYTLVARGNFVGPDGAPFVNDADCWELLESASKAARWLGYVPWTAISDARNAEPIIREHESEYRPKRWHAVRGLIGASFDPIDVESIAASVWLSPPKIQQPFHIVFWGEKTSLGDVLEPLSARFSADLYLPSGETSDSQLALMGRVGETDGRPMVVFVFADCDPAGYQMATSIGHKLRALRDSQHPDLKFEVHAPALTVPQVKRLGLPSTPLKDTERRADGWRARYGIEQTEVDALATLQPRVLRDIVIKAATPFYDSSLFARCQAANSKWLNEAQSRFDSAFADVGFADHRERIGELSSEIEGEIAALKERVASVKIELPDVEIPEPELAADRPEPLVSSEMALADAIKALRARKDYTIGGTA